MNGDSKYKMFRNFMVNELGIGRADIEQWTKEAVAAQVDAYFARDGVSVEELARAVVASRLATPQMVYILRREISEAIAKRLQVTFKNG